MKFTLQPALNYKGTMWSPGYSYPYFGGDCTYCIIPQEVFELGCFLEYKGDAFFEASLAEPYSCSIGAAHATFHTKMGVYQHEMGIREGGKMAILAGAGPMGLGMAEYIIHCDRRPGTLVVTDIDEARLERARELFPKELVEPTGVNVMFVNTRDVPDAAEYLKGLVGGGYDDVFAYAPVTSVVELASDILGRDGCLNFFAGPTDNKFSAKLNYYDVHYNSTHVIGTTGGNTADMVECLELTAAGKIRPAVMVTHIGGLDSSAETTLNLPKIPGGKKLIYTHINMPLTAIDDFGKLGEKDPRFAELDRICKAHSGLWCGEAERYLLSNWENVD